MTKRKKYKSDVQLRRESIERSEAGEPDTEYEDYERYEREEKKYPRLRHTEMCLRFGVAVGCPVCDYTGSLINKEEIREGQMRAKLRIDKYGV